MPVLAFNIHDPGDFVKPRCPATFARSELATFRWIFPQAGDFRTPGDFRAGGPDDFQAHPGDFGGFSVGGWRLSERFGHRVPAGRRLSHSYPLVLSNDCTGERAQTGGRERMCCLMGAYTSAGGSGPAASVQRSGTRSGKGTALPAAGSQLRGHAIDNIPQ